MKHLLRVILPAVGLASAVFVPSTTRAQRLVESRFRAPSSEASHRPTSSLSAQPQAHSLFKPQRSDTSDAKRPQGKQIVAGYMGAVLIGFLAWRVYDEPAGKQPKVDQDWGYTPRAHTAFGIGSYVGATLGVWGMGRREGSNGNLFATALGAAIPTVWVLNKRNDPLLPFIGALFGAPLQGIFAYTGYKATAKPAPAAK